MIGAEELANSGKHASNLAVHALGREVHENEVRFEIRYSNRTRSSNPSSLSSRSTVCARSFSGDGRGAVGVPPRDLRVRHF